MRDLLGRLGDVGLFAPPLIFLVGLALPALAQAGQIMLVPCVVVLLAMTVGLAEPGRILRSEWPPVLALSLCSLILTPIFVHVIAVGLGLGDAGGWLVLMAACPAAGGAALVASLLRLPMRPLLLAQLLCFFALPVTAPLIAWLVLEGAVIDPLALFGRVLLMVGGPALLGFLLRRALGEQRREHLARPMRGLGVLALCGIALSLAAGLPAGGVSAAGWNGAITGLVLASMVGAGLGLLAARMMDVRLAGAFTLGGAVRNVSLLWSATIGIASPEGELVMMLGTLWTILLPALLGLRGWWPERLARALAVGVLGVVLVGGGSPL